ncbi:hypothetical protein SAMN05519103_08682 [Rhizobiales bacterium GAS113]|nr:hypothetical protein SAMN05519103_08682 [Rhizobiales bacterium GAS113]
MDDGCIIGCFVGRGHSRARRPKRLSVAPAYLTRCGVGSSGIFASQYSNGTATILSAGEHVAPENISGPRRLV